MNTRHCIHIRQERPDRHKIGQGRPLSSSPHVTPGTGGRAKRRKRGLRTHARCCTPPNRPTHARPRTNASGGALPIGSAFPARGERSLDERMGASGAKRGRQAERPACSSFPARTLPPPSPNPTFTHACMHAGEGRDGQTTLPALLQVRRRFPSPAAVAARARSARPFLPTKPGQASRPLRKGTPVPTSRSGSEDPTQWFGGGGGSARRMCCLACTCIRFSLLAWRRPFSLALRERSGSICLWRLARFFPCCCCCCCRVRSSDRPFFPSLFAFSALACLPSFVLSVLCTHALLTDRTF